MPGSQWSKTVMGYLWSAVELSSNLNVYLLFFNITSGNIIIQSMKFESFIHIEMQVYRKCLETWLCLDSIVQKLGCFEQLK
jgi:hypothetical protein